MITAPSRSRWLLVAAVAAIVAACWLAAVRPAYAVDPQPPLTGATLLSDSFDTASPGVTLASIDYLTFPSTAYWGVLAGRGVNGTAGLWCAGTPVPPGAVGSTYPSESYGLATVDLSTSLPGAPGETLADFYSSRLELSYTMPTLGGADGESFNVGWGPSDGSIKDTHTDFARTSVGSWARLGYDISQPVPAGSYDRSDLSRTAGKAYLQWVDFPEGYGQSGNGAGVTVDDLLVSGYKYGPVGALTAQNVSGGVQLTWQRPVRSTFAAAPAEERQLSYRVWRRATTESSWKELTAVGRLADSAVSYTDPSPSAGVTYSYLVQPWDPGTGTGYGEASTVGIGQPGNADLALTVTPSATKVVAGSSVTLTYLVANTGSVGLTGVSVNDGGSVVGSVSSLSAGSSAQFTRTLTASSDLNANGLATGAYGSTTVSAAGGATVRVPVSRAAGADRFATAVAVSKRAFSSAPVVVIASGRRWQDPLIAASLAGASGGPMLLADTNSLPAVVSAELARLAPSTIYVVGDTTAISATALSQIKAARPAATVTRIAGTDIYDTSRLVAAKVASLPGKGSTMFLATSANFPDALAASSMAAAWKDPIVLSPATALPAASRSAIVAFAPTRIVVCGGTGAVPDAIASAALAAAGPSATLVRKGGADRYETAALLVRFGTTESGVGSNATLYLATGANYPDALAGGVLAGIGAGRWQPMLLTKSPAFSAPVASYLADTRAVTRGVLLGGTGVVTPSVEQALVAALP